ncbi:putative membrane protein [uncultured Gammaproteobacteria bacterium]
MSNLTLYLAYLGTSIVLLVAFVAIYVVITPYNELSLIRAGNRTAAISLGGTLIGFALPLTATVAHASGWLDLVLWATVALACQLAVFGLVSSLIGHFSEGIEADKTGYGIILAAMSIAVGLLNAGAVTP